jgi:hypothetical protein
MKFSRRTIQIASMLIICGFGHAEDDMPYPVRQSAKVEWQQDLTDSCIRGDGLKMLQVLDRERRGAVNEAGKIFTYSLRFKAPAGKAAHGLVLEFSNSRVIESLKCGQRMLPRRASGKAWRGMEGLFFLPEKEEYEVKFTVTNLLHLYPNAFGRVVVRPASLGEAIELPPLRKELAEVTLRNNAFKAEQVSLETVNTDYFGVILGRKEEMVAIPAQESRTVSLRLPENRWKSVFTIKQGKEKSLSYYDFCRENTWITSRPEMRKLSSGWQFVPGGGGSVPGAPPVDGWEMSSLPIQLSQKAKTHFLWVKNRITVPQEWQGMTLALYLPGVQHKADIFINGDSVGSLYRWETPSSFPLGKWVRPGETFELLMCLTDYTVGLSPGSSLPAPGVCRVPQGGVVAPVSTFSWERAAPLLDTAPELIAEPAVRVEHAFIKTFVAGGKRLELEAELSNTTDRASAVVLKSEVFHAGRKVFELPEEKRLLPARKVSHLTLRQKWRSAMLWTPDSPYLYEMRLTLCREDGQKLDVRRERFGMREVAVSGTHFVLNGKPYRPYGFSVTKPFNKLWPYQPPAYQFFRHMFQGSRNLRKHWKSSESITNIQIGDELGICSSGQNPYHNEYHSFRYDHLSDLLWKRLYQGRRQIFRAVCNSPSIVMWDLGNEIYLRQKGAAEKAGDLFEKMSRLDPTRPVSMSGPTNLPVGPAVKTATPHGWCWADRRTYFLLHPEERPAYMNNQGIFNYIPKGEDSRKWGPALSMMPASYAKRYFKQNPLRQLNSKAVVFGECMYMHAYMVPGLSGESLYFPLMKAYSHMTTAVGRKYMVRMTRHAEPAAFLGHVEGTMTKDLAPVCAYTADQKLRFRSGEKIRLSLDVFNSHYFQNKLKLTVTLRNGGRDIAVKTRKLKMGVCEKRMVTLDFGSFEAKEKDLRFDMLVNVESAHGARFSDWEEVFVYRKADFSLPGSTRLSLYDPHQRLATFLTGRNVPFAKLQTCSEWIPGKKSLLLVAPNSLRQNDVVRELATKLKTGGRIVVLDHDVLPDLTSLELSLADEKINTFTYPLNRPDSPFYRQVVPEDWRFWNTLDQDLLVSRNMIYLPVKGNFRIYGAGNYADGMKAGSTPILEIAVGSGSVIYSQFNLSRALETEPAAERILALLLTSPITREFKECGVLMPPLKLSLIRAKTGLTARAVSKSDDDLADLKILLIDADSLNEISRGFQTRLQQWCRNGGEILIQNIRDEHEAELTRFLGEKVSVKSFPLDRARFTTNDPLTAGISNGELFWNITASGANRQIRYVNEKIPMSPQPQQPGHDMISLPGAIDLIKPSYLVKTNWGKGSVLLSSLRCQDSQISESRRLYCMLLTNLGIALDPEATARLEEKSAREFWNYMPIDLRQLANRGFVDDPRNRVHGWTGAGCEDDLFQFPTGKQEFCGIPFDIIPAEKNKGRTCIAVANPALNKGIPSEIKNLPVKDKFDRLVFLYGAGWRGTTLKIRVQYAERRTWIPGAPDPFVDIPIRPGMEIDDWYSAKKYLSGELALPVAKLAWSGYSRLTERLGFPVGVFLYTWDNPHPEKEIEAIDIIAPPGGDLNKGGVFLMGLNGAKLK